MKAIYGVVDGKRKIIILETRNCEVCGNEFEPKKQESKYCSRRCGKKADYKRHAEYNRKKSSEWYKNNLERANESRKAKYWSNPEYYRAKVREYRMLHKEQKKKADALYYDKIVHGGKRKRLIEDSKYVCKKCGGDTRKGYRSTIAHHTTFDSTDHANQEIVCRSCHAKVHQLGTNIRLTAK